MIAAAAIRLFPPVLLWCLTSAQALGQYRYVYGSAEVRPHQRAADSPPPGRYLYARHVGMESGLPSNAVQDIAVAPDHALWIATDIGLFRYNGLEFEQTPLVSPVDNRAVSRVYQIEIDSLDNKFLLFLNDGFGVLDRNNRFRHFKKMEGQAGGLLENSCWRMKDFGEQVILIYRQNGFALYDKKKGNFDQILPSRLLPEYAGVPRFDEMMTAVPDPEHPGVAWIAGVTGLFRWDQSTRALDYFTSPSYAPARSIWVHTDGKAYMGAWGGGMQIFDTRTREWAPRAFPGNRPDAGVVSWVGARNPEEVWVSAYPAGLYAYNCATQSWRMEIPFAELADFNLDPGRRLDAEVEKMRLLHDGAWAILKSAEKGLAFVYPRAQYFRKIETGMPVQHPIFGPEGRVWLTTNSPRILETRANLARIREIPVAAYQNDFGFRGGFCDSVGDVYFVGWRGIYRLKKGETMAKSLHWPLLDSLVNAGVELNNLEKDDAGLLWVGTSRGFAVQPAGRSARGRYLLIADTLSNGPTTWSHTCDFHRAPGGRQWFLSDYGFGYTEDQGRSAVLYKAANFEKAGLGLSEFRCFATDGMGRLWVSHEGNGLAWVRQDGDHPQPVQLYVGDAARIRLRSAKYITSDKNGDIWGVTPEGLFRIQARTLALQTFGLDYGFGWGELITLDTFPGGRLFAGARNGFFIFHPDSLAAQDVPTRVVLRRVIVLGEDRDTLYHPVALESAFNCNSFYLELETGRYFQAGAVRYQYKLEDYHTDWIETDANRISLWNIPPGNYRLLLRASSLTGIFTGAPLTGVPFNIRPAFWQTLWFRAGLLAALLGAVGFVVWFRGIRRQRRAEAEKRMAELELSALRAQMNPHFIFNAFNSIKWYLIQGEIGKSEAYIDKFSRLIRLVLESSRAEFTSLARELDIIRLSLDLERTRLQGRFDYSIHVGEGIDPEFIQIPPLILQPFVENSVWHGLAHKTDGQGLLEVRVEPLTEGIRCIIEDNGIGREQAKAMRSRAFQTEKSLGIGVSRERIALLSRQYFQEADLVLEDVLDPAGKPAGTRVTLTFIF
jgi:ligand-binding sensor domain-containing protein